MKKKNLLFFILWLSWICVKGQSAFNQHEFIDINNIRAIQLVHGDMWCDPDASEAKCEFPKNSSKRIGFSGSIWMSGYDAGNNLHVAAQTYRQNGNDYWPGPHDNNATALPYSVSANWAKIWKLNRTTINYFKGLSSHTIANTPTSILEWPAKGNPYAKGNNNATLTITSDLAPFVDVNNDGVYNALNGDYPLIKGDQMLWNVFNDNGATHNESAITPLNVSVNQSVYGYQRNSPIDNILYYEYEISNKSNNVYDSFVVGIYADMDLGYFRDDYTGFDSSRRMGYTYNGDMIDGQGEINSYGDTIPMVGIRILELPGDSCNNYAPLGSFMYSKNNADAIIGNPSLAYQFNHLLRHRWRNGSPLAAPNSSASNGTGSGTPVNYVYDNSMQLGINWNECSLSNTPDDMRMVIASAPMTLLANQTIKVSFALIASPREYQNGCPSMNFSNLNIYSDTAQKIYCNPLPYLTTGINDFINNQHQLIIYPNPANDILYIEKTLSADTKISITDALGRNIQLTSTTQGNKTMLNISQLPSGIYLLLLNDGKEIFREKFVKN